MEEHQSTSAETELMEIEQKGDDKNQSNVPELSFQTEKTFKDLQIKNGLIEQLEKVGIKYPSLVQINCIPEILRGRDCIACAPTGTGKTLAFALPIIQNLLEDPFGIYGLIISPTRELAAQICSQFYQYSRMFHIYTTLVTGGRPYLKQAANLEKRPHIVVATPGRLAEIIYYTEGIEKHFSRLKVLVLDEVDQLLTPTYEEHLKTILSVLPTKRQTLLFSATITSQMIELKETAMANTNPLVWGITMSEKNLKVPPSITHKYVECDEKSLDTTLVYLLEKYFKFNKRRGQCIVFVGTRKKCQALSLALQELKYPNVSLHAAHKQNDRMSALRNFKSGAFKLLLATDLGSRGLDIPRVDFVINHSLPMEPKIYVHRIGRTARAGRNGMALSLLVPQQIKRFQEVEKLLGKKIAKYHVSKQMLLAGLEKVSMAVRKAEIKMEQDKFDEQHELYNRRKKLLNKQEEFLKEHGF